MNFEDLNEDSRRRQLLSRAAPPTDSSLTTSPSLWPLWALARLALSPTLEQTRARPLTRPPQGSVRLEHMTACERRTRSAAVSRLAAGPHRRLLLVRHHVQRAPILREPCIVLAARIEEDARVPVCQKCPPSQVNLAEMPCPPRSRRTQGSSLPVSGRSCCPISRCAGTGRRLCWSV